MGPALSSTTKRLKKSGRTENRTPGDGDEGRKPSTSASFGMAPTANSKDKFLEAVDHLIAEHRVVIFSKSYCPYCNQAKDLFRTIGVDFFALELDQHENGADIQKVLLQKSGQRTVPAVFVNGVHVGGYDDTYAANTSGRLKDLLEGEMSYDYDLIVIGGGSGGLAASKEASKLGKKVAVFDFVVPSPVGTSWGLGGTCVNVGCIPKKLMHQAAILGHNIEDARKFGWLVAEDVKHDWETMKDNVQSHIGSLNWGYRVQLREKKVNYINAYAKFIGPHTVEATDRKGKKQILTADKFILATGLRPKYPEIPGDMELGITSDDLFSLSYPPGKTCVIGASYVALECAGFLRAIGFEVTVLVRSILLRGFDQDMAERIGKYMENGGIRIVRECKPIKIERLEEGQPGLLRVTSQKSDGEIVEEEYNTIMFAIGRDACTTGIGLDTIGVELNSKNNKVIAVNEQTNIPYVYAIGDILDGKPELTPVAIQAGKLLSRRLFAGSKLQCDYINIPTTVFTPIEYGCIGYSEEDAIALFGEDDLEVYHTGMWPLEYTVAKRSESDCYLKLICVKSENEKVVGFHYLGPNAGEVTQGFGLGVKMGATKAHFDDLIGIHPTCAEGFTTMEITKRSGVSVKASGC